MHPNKAPGPDRMNPFFFQHYWAIIDKSVTKAVLDILNGAPLPPSFNHTNVALITKKSNPLHLSESRPISLCNVIYILVTKVMSDRLKLML